MKRLHNHVADITGFSSKKEFVEIPLDVQKLKHIRRALYFYEWYHPNIYDDNLTNQLIESLQKFGFLNRGTEMHRDRKLKIIERDKFTCRRCSQIKPIGELTINHKLERSNGGGHNKENAEVLCIKCRDIENIEYRIRIKEEELQRLKDRLLGKNIKRYTPSKEEIEFADLQVEYEFSELKQ